MKQIKALYTNSRLYLISTCIIILFITGFFFDVLFLIAKVSLLAFVIAFILDLYLLFLSKREILLLRRNIPERLSNGDENSIVIYVKNNHFFDIAIKIIDEIPWQFQVRDFAIQVELRPQKERKLSYSLRPVERGEYKFGKTNAFVSTKIGLLCRRYCYCEKGEIVPVYPSFLQMRKYELLAISNRLSEVGVKRIRRIGTHSEFDQIKEYVQGDNYKTINWKATAKKARLMVNKYQDERSQQIYSLIDKGRLMKMPFEGMSLLDYAINASLIISNTAISKHDKAGLVCFNTAIDTFLPAERKSRTITRILEGLYKQDTQFYESDYSKLLIHIRRFVTHRSLLILYTNFESVISLQRQMKFLLNLAKNHLLLVVLFENTEIKKLTGNETHTLQDMYIHTIAEKFIYDKRLIVKELNKHGILSVLTPPGQLTTNLINKYLELKDRGIL